MKVAVVGAGPGGTSAAYHLACAGHEVTLVDKSRFPRPKTCGDWITRGALVDLERMGLPPAQLRARCAEFVTIQGSILGAPNGKTSHVPVREQQPGCCIPRHIFDALLYHRAIEAGCQTQTEGIGDLQTSRERNLDHHDCIVDARGVYAGQPNTVALRAYWSVPTSAVDEATRTTVQIFTVGTFKMGYGWIFPVHVTAEQIKLNIGIGIWKDEYNARGVKIREDFERFIEHNPTARRLARVATEQGRTRGHHLALATGQRIQVASGGMFKIGDAANLTDPITGEGIGNALRSGWLVAQAIDSAGNLADAEHRWQHAYDTQLLPEFVAALRLRNTLLGTRRKNLAIWALRASRGLAERFHGSLEGVIPYRDVLPGLSWGSSWGLSWGSSWFRRTPL